MHAAATVARPDDSDVCRIVRDAIAPANGIKAHIPESTETKIHDLTRAAARFDPCGGPSRPVDATTADHSRKRPSGKAFRRFWQAGSTPGIRRRGDRPSRKTPCANREPVP
jgi:hypothetical protein